ncbi:hypothetical protein U1Q18_049905 [Sarracenia purpurea var. burkii]
METDSGTFQQTWSRFVLYSSPGTLQEVACIPIAAYLTCCKKNQFLKSCIEYNNEGFIDYVDNIHLINVTQLSSVVLQKIDKCAHVMWNSLFEWWDFHNGGIIEKSTDKDSTFEWIHLMSWRADGTINYVQTARNLLDSDALSGEEKYRLACSYCFVEDVVRLLSKKHEHWNPLVNYWNCRMEGKISEDSLLLDHSIDIWLTQSALDYLWEYLTNDQQIVLIIYRSECIENFLGHILCKLKARQLEYLIESHADRVFDNLYEHSETLTLLLWNHIKHVISADSFYKIIDTLDYEKASKMWSSASDVLKARVLARYSDTLLESMCHDHPSLSDAYRDPSFMIELISRNPSEKREAVWRLEWNNIILGFSSEHLQIMMKLFLGSDDKVALFKKTHMCNYSEIRYYLQKMVEYKRFSELNEFLRFATNDPEFFFDLRIRVLKSEYFLENYISSVVHDNQYHVALFDRFVNETFSDADQLNEFKRYLIMSEESMKYFRSSMEKGKLHRNIKAFCDHVLSSMPNVLTQVKSWLLEVGRDILISAQFENFSGVSWDNFLGWCLNSEDDSLMGLKNTLPFDEIFSKLIERLRYQLNLLTLQPGDEIEPAILRHFKVLDAFLLWFFKDLDKIKDFKLSKLKARNDIKEIRSLFELNNRVLVDTVLSWFLS